MKKLAGKMASFALVLSLMLPTVTFAGALEVYADAEEDWSYEVTENNGIGEISITGYNGKDNDVKIPDSLEGKMVTGIGDEAFSGCSSLSSITMPEGVKSIGDWAFCGCSGISSIEIPESVTSIGNTAFVFCSSLSNIKVNEKNKVYDSRNNCNAVIETLGNELVVGCRKTTIPQDVTSIGDEAFSGCSNLSSITIPEGVKGIGNKAFYKCISLSSITVPEGVTSIGNEAFYGCSSLSSIGIPESVTNIGDYAFSECISLSSITVDEKNKVYDSRNNCNAVIETLGNNLVIGCQNTTIPKGVTSIGDSAFLGCSGLSSITIPEGVTSVGIGAFLGCSSLSSITIPEGVTSIGGVAFSECSSLRSITIPEGVTSIGMWAFKGCSSLSSITIPEGVTSIGGGAFIGCSPELVFRCPKNSYAAEYAEQNGIKVDFPKSLDDNQIKISIEGSSFEYDGKEKTPAIMVKDGATVLKEGTDYTVTYEDNIEVGLAKAIITGKGNYTGRVEKFFKIKQVIIPAPSGLKQSAANAGTIKITWQKAGGMTGYEVYRSTKKKSGFKKVASVKGNSYTDKKLKPGTSYYYKVRSYKMVGNSIVISNYSSVYKAVTVPDAVKVTLKAGKSQFKVSWKKVNGAVKYEVYIASSKNGSYKKAAVTNGISYTKKRLKKGQKCYVKVRSYAVDGKGRKWYSAYSSIKSVKVK